MKSFNEFLNENVEYSNDILNEDDEVSVDKVLDAKMKKRFKEVFNATDTGIDKLSFKRDGTIVAKRGFFYTHGQTSIKVAERLKKSMIDNGIEIEIIEHYEDWKPWPKDSNFVVIFKIK